MQKLQAQKPFSKADWKQAGDILAYNVGEPALDFLTETADALKNPDPVAAGIDFGLGTIDYIATSAYRLGKFAFDQEISKDPTAGIKKAGNRFLHHALPSLARSTEGQSLLGPAADPINKFYDVISRGGSIQGARAEAGLAGHGAAFGDGIAKHLSVAGGRLTRSGQPLANQMLYRNPAKRQMLAAMPRSNPLYSVAKRHAVGAVDGAIAHRVASMQGRQSGPVPIGASGTQAVQ